MRIVYTSSLFKLEVRNEFSVSPMQSSFYMSSGLSKTDGPSHVAAHYFLHCILVGSFFNSFQTARFTEGSVSLMHERNTDAKAK